MEHNHRCLCGTSTVDSGHETGENGCQRFMTDAPKNKRYNNELHCWEYLVGGHWITEFSLLQQRGYKKHECGCWSRWEGSENSISA
jgi:hypothetical protein